MERFSEVNLENQEEEKGQITLESSTYEGGERIEKYILNAGSYNFQFGFRKIDSSVKDWFHGGNEEELRESKSLVLDVDSDEFLELAHQFELENPKQDNPQEFIKSLNTVMSRNISSSLDVEECRSVSEIIRKGSGACASKSLVAGLIIRNKFPDANVEMITGIVGSVEDKVSYPFSHAWLRVSYGKNVILYDPMYEKFQYFTETKEGYVDGGGNHNFSQYTADAQPLAVVFAKGLKMQRVSGVSVTKSYDGNYTEFFIDQNNNLISQVEGTVRTGFRTNGGRMSLIDGEVWGGVPKGPKIKFPIKKMEVA